MMVVDTSALMAITLNEARAHWCMDALETEAEVLISAGTLAEALIVARRKGQGADLAETIEAFGFTVVPVSEADARRVADAYDIWGKGVHPAALNMGDCFAYALAKERNCPLLYVGNDFAQTDVKGVDFTRGAQ
jgi:ribonuclease VapC